MGWISKKSKATKKNEGQTWFILWNPQGARDLREKPIWREGVIKEVDKNGYFKLEFPYGGYTICHSLKDMKKVDLTVE